MQGFFRVTGSSAPISGPFRDATYLCLIWWQCCWRFSGSNVETTYKHEVATELDYSVSRGYVVSAIIFLSLNFELVSFVVSGQFCTEDVDECQLQPNACQNGGTCTNHNGGYACVCVNGWSGDDCSKNIDDCFTASCANGSTCIDRVASFSCICPEGKAGKDRKLLLVWHLIEDASWSLCMCLKWSVPFTHFVTKPGRTKGNMRCPRAKTF